MEMMIVDIVEIFLIIVNVRCVFCDGYLCNSQILRKFGHLV